MEHGIDRVTKTACRNETPVKIIHEINLQSSKGHAMTGAKSTQSPEDMKIVHYESLLFNELQQVGEFGPGAPNSTKTGTLNGLKLTKRDVDRLLHKLRKTNRLNTDSSTTCHSSNDLIPPAYKTGTLNGLKLTKRDVDRLLHKLRKTNRLNTDSSTTCHSSNDLIPPAYLSKVLGVDSTIVNDWMESGKIPYVTVDDKAFCVSNAMIRIFSDEGINGVRMMNDVHARRVLDMTETELERTELPFLTAGDGTRWYGSCVIMDVRKTKTRRKQEEISLASYASNGDGADHKTVREVTAEPLFTVDEVADLFDTSIDDILDREVSLASYASNGDGADHKTVREVTAEPLFTVDEVADLFDTSIDDILDREGNHQIDWILDDDLEKVYPFSEVHRLEDVYGPSHKLWEAYPYFNKTASRSSDFPRRV